jgi:pseudouridine-5'-phosphate glycosidase
MNNKLIKIRPDVRQAIEEGRPVVALESTIIAHGMPYPDNFNTAMDVEGIIRKAGALPATIAVLNGEMTVGLTEDEVRFLATAKEVHKATERDLPFIIARKLHAAVTVGSSLTIAAAAGIRVFVTGGIGGVGIDAGKTFDISADLLAIAQYPVITVCAGAKAFMDIPATLEYLETQRVPVIAYQSPEFPFFYSRSSGVRVDWNLQSAGEIAQVYKAKAAIGQPGGMLVGVPLPEADALPKEVTQAAVQKALKHIADEGITGKAVTPFLLATIKEETGGKSLTANIALIKNNARVGAEIAVALSEPGAAGIN